MGSKSKFAEALRKFDFCSFSKDATGIEVLSFGVINPHFSDAYDLFTKLAQS